MTTGFLAGNFDVMHPGYIKMFKECRKHCDYLVVFLHTDPSIERPHKLKPILSVEERGEMLLALKAVCQVITYTYEHEFYELMKTGNYDYRFLGDDYKNRNDYTGSDLSHKVIYINRDHGWSTTKYKNMIAESLK